MIPDYYDRSENFTYDEQGRTWVDTPDPRWFTNMDHGRHTERCANEEYANKYLAKGWLLLNQFTEERGALYSYGIVYILGRPKSVSPDDSAPECSEPQYTLEDLARIEEEMRKRG
ncbi:MAG: hypothetical protein IJQ58_04345 [Synergistaceae bacterium]|nr:hypothetical protein [Synergistaceae bacterium]